jgi:hypothetical protein
LIVQTFDAEEDAMVLRDGHSLEPLRQELDELLQLVSSVTFLPDDNCYRPRGESVLVDEEETPKLLIGATLVTMYRPCARCTWLF